MSSASRLVCSDSRIILAALSVFFISCDSYADRVDSSTATATTDELRQSIADGDKRFSIRLAFAKALAADDNVEEAIAQLHDLLNSGFNPAESVLGLAEFENVRAASSFAALRRRLEPCKGGAYDDFSFTIGAWTIENNANEGNAADRSVIAAVANGCALHEKYWTTYGYEAESFKAYDDVHEKWSMLVVDNQGFFLNFVQVSNRDGDEIVLEARDDVAIYRALTTQIDANAFRTVWRWSRDGGTTWRNYVDSEYRRSADGS